jgi:glycosyltransferase involved in cell wall biosynthesis
MRIAHIVGSVEAEASGPSHSVPGLCRELAALGNHVDMLSLGRRVTPERDGFFDLRLPQDLVGAGPFGKLGLSRALRGRLETEPYDVLHTHGLWLMANVYPAATARARGVPLLLSPRGMLGEGALGFSRWRKRAFWALMQKRAARAVGCFHATSIQEYRDIRNFGLRQPVAVIPNGIDIPAPPPDREDRERLVLSLGRVHPKKGLDRLIRAWALLPETVRVGWNLRIVGPDEGNHAAELRRLVAELGLAGVTISEPVFGEEKRRLMARAWVFALPTLSENFAMTVAESLAVETPVISTVGAPWQGLETHRCGWWVEHGPEPMANALAEAMALSPGELAGMGARGRDWMRRDFGWARIAEDMQAVYRWLLGAEGRPPHVITD